MDKTLYEFIDEILCGFNNKIHIGGIFCDLPTIFHYLTLDLLVTTLIA